MCLVLVGSQVQVSSWIQLEITVCSVCVCACRILLHIWWAHPTSQLPNRQTGWKISGCVRVCFALTSGIILSDTAFDLIFFLNVFSPTVSRAKRNHCQSVHLYQRYLDSQCPAWPKTWHGYWWWFLCFHFYTKKATEWYLFSLFIVHRGLNVYLFTHSMSFPVSPSSGQNVKMFLSMCASSSSLLQLCP